MLKVIKPAVCAVVLAALQPYGALAVPISYLYTGTGSGSLSGTAFANAAFTITANGDTDSIVPAQGSDPIMNVHLNTSIAITGLGTFAITPTSGTWIADRCCGGIGAYLGPNWITLDEPAFTKSGYGLDTNFGPVTDSTPLNTEQFTNVPTSGGLLSMPVVSSVTFLAISAVPEPATLLLWAGGITVVMTGVARRRAGRS